MKIKEITDPTLRWAVIRRLLARVPDRPAGAGNFVSGGQFSEPSRRTMRGRHAAERAAKQVWNEVVDELGSRPFFDDALVRVHWIGLYTKRGQDLASNTISYIQEHAGVEHADEISATAYMREDLAKVALPRPMIGVILRGRTTYAGAVDLGTQWSVKLKPEDIERQKGSGTRKLPWYEDEGMIADNMTVDEKSWRDHVWGPQYYRTKMPELVVGSWSFDTVLIPQGVMSGAPDDLQRVIEIASSLGCKVVDERGNRYEPGEKMRITERHLRHLIRETLLNEGFRITNAPREPIAQGEPLLNYATSKGVEDYKYRPPGDTKHTHKMKSNYIPDKQLSSWYKVHWEGVSTLVSEILRWNPRLEKSVYMYRDRSLIGYMSPNPVEADKKRTGAVGILLTGGHVTQVFSSDAQTQYIKTASGWRYYSQFQIDRGIDTRPSKQRLDPHGRWTQRPYTGKPWTVTPEDVPVGVVPEGTVVGATPTAIVVTCLEPFTEPAPPQYDKLLDDLELLDLPILNELLEPVTIGYLRQLIDASRNPDSNLTPTTSSSRPQRIGGISPYRGQNENDKVPTFVDDDFVVRNDPITQLPDGLHVTGKLIAGWPLESLPRGLRVDGDLMIESPFITELPADAEVGKDLYMGSGMTTLPDNLHIKGTLRADRVVNFQYPRGLKVDGNILLSYFPLPALPPDDLQVGGKIYGYRGDHKAQAILAAPHLKDKFG